MLGVVSMINHGLPEMVNSALSSSSSGLSELRMMKSLRAGQELLVSYGSAEWFSDRGLRFDSQLGEENNNNDNNSSNNNNRPPAPRELLELQSGGLCLTDIGPDHASASAALSVTRDLEIGEKITSPAFLLPRPSVAVSSAVEGHCIGHGASEVLVLPLAWPGHLTRRSSAADANVDLALMVDGKLLRDDNNTTTNNNNNSTAQQLCDSPTLRSEVVMTALRRIRAGEVLSVHVAEKVAEQSALLTLDGFFPDGWGQQLDSARLKAAELGNAEAQFQLAQLSRLGSPGVGLPPRPTDATTWYRRAAEQGHAAAQLRLGAACHDGVGQAADPAEAVKWYQKAAGRGSASAQFLLGLAYTNGDGVARNISEASIWLSRAAQQGSSNFGKASNAMYNLAVAYREGIGVAADPVAAAAWFRQAAEKSGNVKAMFNLGVAYSRGDGVTADQAAAAAWYEQAASKGHRMAQYNLGHALYVGAGVGQDVGQAAAWFRLAAEQGSSNAQFMMGVLCSRGRGVPEDLAAAVQWYHEAAAQGHVQAQYNLAVAQAAGAGTPRNLTSAAAWYQQAAANGLEVPSQLPGFGLLARLRECLRAAFAWAGSRSDL
ncbi:unnamed protein product [Polarella glacialis]|uniref:Uncharacterized protein n=1 Tax=Polarella glacialis TaxID=89957 RepID=A0A813KU25_POLGL|nr:unnamed protein product [Polarella glacialis]